MSLINEEMKKKTIHNISYNQMMNKYTTIKWSL